jgi:hypothetical protein
MFTKGFESIKGYIVPGFRDLISESEKRQEMGKKFLKEYLSIIKEMQKTDTVTADKNSRDIISILYDALEVEDPVKYLQDQEDQRLASFIRQLKGKSDISDVIDLFLND